MYYTSTISGVRECSARAFINIKLTNRIRNTFTVANAFESCIDPPAVIRIPLDGLLRGLSF